MMGDSAESAADTEVEEYPPIDFTTFVLSMSTSALMSMGVIADATSGKIECDPGIAKQSIDILTMLEEKTRGNLTGEEERLLGQVLFDLRMRYVACTKK